MVLRRAWRSEVDRHPLMSSHDLQTPDSRAYSSIYLRVALFLLANTRTSFAGSWGGVETALPFCPCNCPNVKTRSSAAASLRPFRQIRCATAPCQKSNTGRTEPQAVTEERRGEYEIVLVILDRSNKQAHAVRSSQPQPWWSARSVLRRRVSIKNPVASGDILANATSHSHAGETHGHRCPMLPFLPAGAWAAVAWAPPPPLRAPHLYGGQNGWMGTPHTHASDAVRSIRSRMFVFGRVIVYPESGFHSDRSDFTWILRHFAYLSFFVLLVEYVWGWSHLKVCLVVYISNVWG